MDIVSELSAACITLFKFLPNDKKASFASDLLKCTTSDGLGAVVKSYYKHLFATGESDGSNFTNVGIIVATTSKNESVNIVFNEDLIYFNSAKQKPISDIIKTMMLNGDIMFRERKYRKTVENKERFHLKFYRVYRKLNYRTTRYPIVLN
jgi:hypothetical protein